jgi:hypothetical protein
MPELVRATITVGGCLPYAVSGTVPSRPVRAAVLRAGHPLAAQDPGTWRLDGEDRVCCSSLVYCSRLGASVRVADAKMSAPPANFDCNPSTRGLQRSYTCLTELQTSSASE